MTTKYGVFKEPTYIGIGDRYVTKKDDKSVAELGLNLKVTTQRTGKGNDATFDKFKALQEGEKFVDPHRLKLMDLAEKRKKNISDNSWKMASPMKKSTGLGDFYGTLQGKVSYISDCPKEKGKKGEYPSEPPNVYTSPAKKGTYGFNKTTVGEKKGAKGVVGEYEYLADPFDLSIKSVQEYEKRKREKRVSELPFKPSNPPKKGGFGVSGLTLGGKGAGVAGEYAYEPLGPEPKGGQKGPDIPFRTPNPARTGYNATLNKFPQHLADPEVPKIQAAREATKLKREKLASQNPWKPSMTYRTDCTRSIVQMNV